jgi:hypothetical protein
VETPGSDEKSRWLGGVVREEKERRGEGVSGDFIGGRLRGGGARV